VYVSTEDAELAGIARSCDAQVVDRPADLARDSSTSASVVEHLLQQVDLAAQLYDSIAILQVTSPLRNVGDILKSRELIALDDYDSVVSAYEETNTHPAKMYYLEDGKAVSVAPQYESSRRQDLPQVFRRNGAIFVVTREHFNRTGRLWGGRTGLVQMPQARSIDVDTLEDLLVARQYLEANSGGDK